MHKIMLFFWFMNPLEGGVVSYLCIICMAECFIYIGIDGLLSVSSDSAPFRSCGGLNQQCKKVAVLPLTKTGVPF